MREGENKRNRKPNTPPEHKRSASLISKDHPVNDPYSSVQVFKGSWVRAAGARREMFTDASIRIHLDQTFFEFDVPRQLISARSVPRLAITWRFASVDKELLEEFVDVGGHDVLLVHFAEERRTLGLRVEMDEMLSECGGDAGCDLFLSSKNRRVS